MKKDVSVLRYYSSDRCTFTFIQSSDMIVRRVTLRQCSSNGPSGYTVGGGHVQGLFFIIHSFGENMKKNSMIRADAWSGGAAGGGGVVVQDIQADAQHSCAKLLLVPCFFAGILPGG